MQNVLHVMIVEQVSVVNVSQRAQLQLKNIVTFAYMHTRKNVNHVDYNTFKI
jgi:hypothetical protein